MNLRRIALAFLIFWSLVVVGAFLTVSAGPVTGVVVVAVGVWTMLSAISVLARTHPA